MAVKELNVTGQGTRHLVKGTLAPLVYARHVCELMGLKSPLSRKGYWHLSRTMATQSGMTNLWLESQGLVSIRKLWIAYHYPAANQSG